MQKWKIIFVMGAVFCGCRKPYNPPAITAPGNYLVVDGVVNPGLDSTFITLSRTVNLKAVKTLNPEKNATVTVEGDDNTSYTLTAAAGGTYIYAGLNLDANHNYRLRIKTADGREYVSDYVPVKITPVIDSIGSNVSNLPDPGLQVYVNTHDDKNNTHYYRWDYQESWVFTAKYVSEFYSTGTEVLHRPLDKYVTFCYKSDTSTTAILGSSAKLTQDIIYQFPIVKVPSTSEKIESKYSILIHQFALTAGGFTFWQNLKKNTEQLGSIFDAQPSQLNGNIRCSSNPAELVIGYVSVSTINTKRVFISNSILPHSWVAKYPYQCQLDSEFTGSRYLVYNLIPYPDIYTPVDSFYVPIKMLQGYMYTTRPCADCSIRGSLTPPSFWK